MKLSARRVFNTP